MHKAFITEERVAREFLEFLKSAKVKIPQKNLGQFTRFLVSVLEANIVGGIKLYSRGHVLANNPGYCTGVGLAGGDHCVDDINHVYYFKVRSEKKKDVEYIVSFQHRDRQKKRHYFELEDMVASCQCAWASRGISTKGGRLRLCKHQFAAMLWLFFNSKEDRLEKLRELVKFLVYSVFWVHPSVEGKLDKVKKKELEWYLEQYDGIFEPLKKKYAGFAGDETKAILRESLVGGLKAISERLLTVSEETESTRLQYLHLAESLVDLPSPESFHGIVKEFEEEFILEARELNRARTYRRKPDASLGKYAFAERLRLRAKKMEEQLENMKKAGKGDILGYAVSVWEKGLDLRRQEFQSLKGGLIPFDLLQQSLESRKKEIEIAVSCQLFYSALADTLSSINATLTRMTPVDMRDAVRKRLL